MLQGLFSKLSGLVAQIKLSTPPADRLLSWQYSLLVIFIFFSCYWGMASYPVLDMNEGLYAEVAREMLAGKHFIIPYLNGVPYLEKPPLLYWLLALSYHIFGLNDFAARLVPSTFTALTAVSWLYFGRKLHTPRTGWIAAMILLTSLAFVIIGRIVFFDMLLVFFVSAVFMMFYLWHQAGRNIVYLYASYIFLALAVLTKGFLALVLIPLILLIYLWLLKAEWGVYRQIFDKKAIILFLAIVLPWHILAMFSHAGFTFEYFINNQLLRFFNLRMPHDYHTGPLYYYLPRMMAYLLPWSLLVIFLLPWPLRLPRPVRPVTDPLKALLWVWILAMLAFFSMAGDKGEYYMIIAAPPLAYLIAQKIDSWFDAENPRWLNGLFVVMSLLLGACGAIALLFYRTDRVGFVNHAAADKIPYVLNGSLILLFLAIVVYGFFGAYVCYRQQARTPLVAFICLCGLMIPNLLFYLSVKERTQLNYSQVALAKYVRAQYEHRPVYIYQDFEAVSSFVYYNREPSVIIDSQSSDLYYGSTTKEGAKYFVSLADFLQQAKQQPVYVLLRITRFADFQKAVGKDAFCAVQRNGNVLLLSNAQEDCKATVDIGEKKDFDLNNIKAAEAGNKTGEKK